MSALSPRLRRAPRERIEAWLVTGPLGHLYSVAVDLTLFAARTAARRLARRS
jgi:hypothetical protein